MFYYKITTDGEVQEIETDKRFELKDFYREIDCDCIQVVKAGKDKAVCIVLDEEGKLKHKEVNEMATMLYEPRYDFIVGDVIVCTEEVVNDIGERDLAGFKKPSKGKIDFLLGLWVLEPYAEPTE